MTKASIWHFKFSRRDNQTVEQEASNAFTPAGEKGGMLGSTIGQQELNVSQPQSSCSREECRRGACERETGPLFWPANPSSAIVATVESQWLVWPPLRKAELPPAAPSSPALAPSAMGTGAPWGSVFQFRGSPLQALSNLGVGNCLQLKGMRVEVQQESNQAAF